MMALMSTWEKHRGDRIDGMIAFARSMLSRVIKYRDEGHNLSLLFLHAEALTADKAASASSVAMLVSSPLRPFYH